MLCVVNAGDMAMCVPGESHVIVREGHVHVGTELRLDSRNSLCLHLTSSRHGAMTERCTYRGGSPATTVPLGLVGESKRWEKKSGS